MRKKLLIAGAFWLCLSAAQAQAVYKCTTNGHTAYSEEPCVGATVVDTTPTEGMDKSSGHVMKGADVQNKEFQDQFAKMIEPATGMTPEQMDVYRRRVKLPAKDQAQCKKLDEQLPEAEQADQRATGDKTKAQADVSLYLLRKQYRDLHC